MSFWWGACEPACTDEDIEQGRVAAGVSGTAGGFLDASMGLRQTIGLPDGRWGLAWQQSHGSRFTGDTTDQYARVAFVGETPLVPRPRDEPESMTPGPITADGAQVA